MSTYVGSSPPELPRGCVGALAGSFIVAISIIVVLFVVVDHTPLLHVEIGPSFETKCHQDGGTYARDEHGDICIEPER